MKLFKSNNRFLVLLMEFIDFALVLHEKILILWKLLVTQICNINSSQPVQNYRFISKDCWKRIAKPSLFLDFSTWGVYDRSVTMLLNALTEAFQKGHLFWHVLCAGFYLYQSSDTCISLSYTHHILWAQPEEYYSLLLICLSILVYKIVA